MGSWTLSRGGQGKKPKPEVYHYLMMCIISPLQIPLLCVYRSKRGFGLIKLACVSAHFLLPHSTHVYPAWEAETHANCSDEAAWENQTSVFNIDDRLACGEFSHPTKQALFLLKRTGTGGLCLAFLAESWDQQRNDLSEGNKEGIKPRGGDRSKGRRQTKGCVFKSLTGVCSRW